MTSLRSGSLTKYVNSKDPFQRREAANEAMYIRNQEKEKYAAGELVGTGTVANRMSRIKTLRQKMKESQKHMEELDKHL